MFKCDNCDTRYEREDQLPYLFPNIPNLLQRLDPGGTVPVGECPKCGALVYPEDQPVRVLVVVEGGLVQDVMADKPGVEVRVLDKDVEGVEEQEIVDVVGEIYTLWGTLQRHDITIAPVLVEAAYR